MESLDVPRDDKSTGRLFAGGGDMGARMRDFDWAASPLGPPQGWSPALQTTLGIVLASHHPMFVFWGPEHRCFYNDAYAPSLGPEQHDVMLGQRAADQWVEIWDTIGPQIDRVMGGGDSTWHENQLVSVTRHGRRENVYWTYGYSPIPDAAAPNGIGGVLVVCTETTRQVLTEQRQRFLVELGDALRPQNDARRIIATAIEAMGKYLGVSRVGYGQVQADNERIELDTNYTNGVAPILGIFRLEEFGIHTVAGHHRGETVVCNDIALDPSLDAAKWAAIETRAFVSVPLVLGGRFRASLFVNDRQPRVWSGNDVTLIERVATRIWEAVERAQAEARLLLTTQRFELALQGSFISLAYQDLDLRYTWYYNFPTKSGDALGLTDADLFCEEDAAVLIGIKREVLASRERRRRTVTVHTQEARTFYDLLVEPILDGDGGVQGVKCAAFDVTDRKNAELAIVEREAQLATLANAMPQLVWIGRPDGALEYVNRRLCEYTGLREDEVIRHDTWRRVVHPQDWDAAMAVWADAISRGAPYTLEQRLRRADGVYRWFLVRAQPERDRVGRLVRWYGTSTDIDEAKRLEKQMMATQAALREADLRKDLFLATLSHELRNPLAPIRNAAQILASPALSPQRLQWAQSVIQRQVKHMAWLLDDLLDVARITQGKLELKKERVTLNGMVDAAVEATQPLFDDKKHRLTVNLPVAAPVLHADPLRISQVLSNLLTNAAKYTDPGGHIELSAQVETNTVRITVTDNGIGIARDGLERIFDMFAQVDASTPRAEGGLGIGLSIVKGLVELHGGSVAADSDGVAQGSRFTVRLPIITGTRGIPEEDWAPTGDAATVAPPKRARRVLVADDNRDAADSLAMLLQIDGHDVRVAHGGGAALAIAQAFRPQVALLDIGMPDMTGYEVASALRREDWGKDIYLIALTGWGQEADRRRSREAGFDRHLTKPADPDELKAVLA
jgi:PAS domain S-box-containing protein